MNYLKKWKKINWRNRQTFRGNKVSELNEWVLVNDKWTIRSRKEEWEKTKSMLIIAIPIIILIIIFIIWNIQG